MKKRADGRYVETITVTLPNGRTSRKYFYGRTQAELRRKLVEYRGEVQKGPLFSTVAEEWKEAHFARVAHKTTECYNAPFARALEWFQDHRISDITPVMLNGYVGDVARQGYSLRTVRAHIAVLNMIFEHAIYSGYLEHNPASSVKPPAGLKTTRRELPPDGLVEKIEQSISLDFGLFAYLLLYTGMRRGEALALRWEDIDFDAKMIHVTKSIYHDNNKAVVKAPKSSAGTRDIILLDRLSAQLPKRQRGYVFDRDGQPLTLSAFQKRWKKYCLAAGLAVDHVTENVDPNTKRTRKTHAVEYLVTPHQLRHAYATILFEAGLDEKDAQELLGHSTIALTRDIYTHIRSTRKQKSASRLNDHLAQVEAEKSGHC